jgi:hypothetical protein
MTTNKLALTVAAVATLALAVPAYAQSSSKTDTGVVISAQGGGLTSVTDLNDAKTAKFKTGFNLGGSLGWDFNSMVSLRGTYTYGRSDTDGTAFPAGFGKNANRQYYGAELKLSAPGPISPYLLVGGGAATVKVAGQSSFTKPAGKAGVGLSIDIPNTPVSIFGEGTGWAYKFDQFGFDKTQFDLAWSAGLSVRFGK